MKTRKHRRAVTIAILAAYASNRNFLKGIASYLRTHGGWNVNILKTQDELVLDRILDPRADGIITIRPRNAAVHRAMDASKIPLVIIGTRGEWFRRRHSGYTIIRSNDEGIGRCAADYFRSLGNFRSFGFIAAGPDLYWSDERLHGFAERLESFGSQVSVFTPSAIAPTEDDRQRLSNWLTALPKPAAVLGAYDDIAVAALNACNASGIDVPRQVAVLGVDNDELLCDFSEPALSSIAPDALQAGESAARELDALMRAQKPRSTRTILIEHKQVIERDSTAPVSQSSHLVERALAYIREHATDGIRVMDVVRRIGVSRSLADRIFREQHHATIRETITAVRIDRVKQMLRTTKLTVRKITAVCGFPSETYAKRVFRKSVGTTPGAYRAAQRG